MPLTEVLIRGANASVVVFVVSSTLSVGLGLTMPQIVAPLRNGRLVALSLLANFVLAPVAAIGLADDLWSGGERGFRAHLGSRRTTGVVKLIGIPLVGLAASRKLSGALLVGLAANFLN